MTAFDVISVIGVILAFVVIFTLVYKGAHVVWATFAASLILILTNWMNLMDSIDLLFAGWGDAIPTFVPIVLFGSLFSKVMEHTGAARSFALTIYGKLIPKSMAIGMRRNLTIIITILLEVILVYAGVDIFAITFMMVPILGSVCNELNIPRRFIPALILSAAGAACALPGCTNISNTIPMQLLETYPMAGTVPGFVAGAVVIFGCCLYMCRATRKAINKGETFDWGPVLEATTGSEENLPHFVLSIIPLIVVIIGFNVLNLSAYALALASIIGLIVLIKYVPIPEGKDADLKGKASGIYDLLMKGLMAIAPLLLIFLSTGFATLVSSSNGYQILLDLVLQISLPSAVTYGIIAFLLVGIMINPIGALMVAIPFALSALPDLAPAAIHRISSFAYIVLDSLPFAAGIILAQGLVGTKAKESYKPIFFTTVVWAFVGLVICVLMYVINPSWA